MTRNFLARYVSGRNPQIIILGKLDGTRIINGEKVDGDVEKYFSHGCSCFDCDRGLVGLFVSDEESARKKMADFNQRNSGHINIDYRGRATLLRADEGFFWELLSDNHKRRRFLMDLINSNKGHIKSASPVLARAYIKGLVESYLWQGFVSPCLHAESRGEVQDIVEIDFQKIVRGLVTPSYHFS